jgi:hypothetical protein
VKFVEPLKTAARPAVGRRTKYYQFTAIDDCTRLRVLRIYSRCDQKTAIQFVDYVLERLPFPVQVIQTDNGAEFQSAFHYHVLDKGVGHRYIKPRTPRLNGKVERSHRIDAEADTFDILRRGPKVVSVASLDPATARDDLGTGRFLTSLLWVANTKIRRRSRRRGIGYRSLMMHPSGDDLDVLARLVDGGQLKPVTGRVFPLSGNASGSPVPRISTISSLRDNVIPHLRSGHRVMARMSSRVYSSARSTWTLRKCAMALSTISSSEIAVMSSPHGQCRRSWRGWLMTRLRRDHGKRCRRDRGAQTPFVSSRQT